MSAREAILARIREVAARSADTADRDYGSIEKTYRRTSGLTPSESIDLFAARIEHYDGCVLRCTRTELPATIAHALSARGKTRVHVAPDIDRTWLPRGIEFVSDERASAIELDGSDGVITGCTVAIALTGTIVLTHARGEGRRALTLVPDYHLTVVFVDQIVETVPEGIHRAATSSPPLITTISGPSATADIEMTRIKGVHGPRTLDVILVTPDR